MASAKNFNLKILARPLRNKMAPKARTQARGSKSTKASQKSHNNNSVPPEPFKLVPEHLQPFLSELSTKHVYITHIDKKPKDFKRNIFVVPFLMNLAIILLILWRIKTIAPFYLQILLSLGGQHNETTIDKSQLSSKQIVVEILKRTGTFMFDLILYAFVLPWPKEFFVGGANGSPLSWRIYVGFRDKEIYVRRSRSWDKILEDPVIQNGPGQQLLFPIVWKAVDPSYMREKTGYNMLNNEWELDWKSIITATKLVDTQKLGLDDFKTTTYIHSEQFSWLILETVAAGGSAKEEEGRKKIVAFKDTLTAMGKENLFFRWIELVQFESSQPGGFGPDRQAKTMEKAKELFESQGVNFDEFWEKIGGAEGLPGME